MADTSTETSSFRVPAAAMPWIVAFALGSGMTGTGLTVLGDSDLTEQVQEMREELIALRGDLASQAELNALARSQHELETRLVRLEERMKIEEE